MKRAIPIVLAVLVVAVVGVGAWQHCGGTSEPPASDRAPTARSTAGAAPSHATAPRVDPRTAPRASIAGTVTDETKAPAAHVQVCADGSSPELPAAALKDPLCTTTDDRGVYQIANLLAASYEVTAGGKPYLPEPFHPDGDRQRTSFPLASGQAKTGVDIVVRHGGVAITGAVSDISGGGIGHAHVRAAASRWGGGATTAPTETDDAGKFTLWVPAGPTFVTASADGYADATANGRAPGTFELRMTPESSLAGIVVDAKSARPVPGVRVHVSQGDWESGEDKTDISDAEGKWRVAGLTPGRYVASGKSPSGYGRTEGSVLVGLGQHVEGVTVKLFPAHRIEGHVMIAGAPPKLCVQGSLYLNDAAHGRYVNATTDPDGIVHADGVLPGTYSVEVGCPHFVSREKYDPIVVADRDATGLTWEVAPGATIRGKLATKAGEPIAAAPIWAQKIGGAARAKSGWGNDTSTRDGTYELDGLRAGAYKLNVSTDKGVPPAEGFEVAVGEGATVDKDLVLDDGGKIAGTVVDEAGKPVPDVDIRPQALAAGGFGFRFDDAKSDAAGNFTIDGVRPGEYRVVAALGWMDELRKPGSTDDSKRGEHVTVKANATATVRLVVESRANAITGVVLDADGKPVSDAYLSSARESDAAGAGQADVRGTRGWGWFDGDKPVLTATDGTFTIGKLSKGNYTVRAYRKGGGEAVMEHVAAGTKTTLQMKRTGSLAGRVTGGGGAVTEFTIAMSDPKTAFDRTEHFYMTDGAFAVKDLPGGHFRVTAASGEGQKTLELDLADGEAKTGVELAMDVLVDVTGRVVESGTQKPVAGMRMLATPTSTAGGAFTFSFGGGDDERENITDDSGRFKVKRVPVGQIMVRGFPKDFRDSDYSFFTELRTVPAGTTGAFDVGDLAVIKKRVKPGDKVGELGVHFAEQPPDTAPDKRELKVSWIDPAGPAAKVGLEVGDIITTVDGTDITGASAPKAWTLLNAPPATTITLGLARGTSVAIVLASP